MKKVVLVIVLLCVTIVATAQSSEYFKLKNIETVIQKTAKWQSKSPKYTPNNWINGKFIINLNS
jgi:hypothetical protein